MNQGKEYRLFSFLKVVFFSLQVQEVHHFIMLHVVGMLSVVRCVPLLFAFLSDSASIVGASSEVVMFYPNFQLLISRGASLDAENVNGYDILHDLKSSKCPNICRLVSLFNIIISRVGGQKHI